MRKFSLSKNNSLKQYSPKIIAKSILADSKKNYLQLDYVYKNEICLTLLMMKNRMQKCLFLST